MTDSLWKVLIADDEPIIREGIRYSVNWDRLNMEVVAEAEDGEEAIEKAILHTVDILLVDINMPIVNGLKVIQQVKTELPHCQVVIITGYDEFKYAQEAVRLHVSDYLLKPVDPDQLEVILNKIQEELVKRKEQNHLWSNTFAQISKNMSTLKMEFCREWLLGNLHSDEIESQLRFLQLPVSIPQQFLAISSTEYIEKRQLMVESEKESYQKKLIERITTVFTDYDIILFHDDMGSICILAWQVFPSNFAARIEEIFKKEWNMYITVYTRENAEDYVHITSFYKEYRDYMENEINISPIVRRAKTILEHRYNDPTISLEKVAIELQVSSVYLSRLFKKELGMNFVQLLTRKRISKAIYLLQSTDYPIVAISEQVGYDSQHYFSTAFKKATGVSPNRYRRNLVQENIEVK